MDILLISVGLVLLIAGGELLVRGAATSAERLGMSPLLVGLTIVGFGTSMPELVTSVKASLHGSPGIAVGNIVGSNIANSLLIVGVAALISPLAVSGRALARDGVVMLLAALGLVGVGLTITPLERGVGAILVAGLIGYLWYAYIMERRADREGHTAAFDKSEAHELVAPVHSGGLAAAAPSMPVTLAAAGLPLAMALSGLAVVILGGRLVVEGAIGLAHNLGLSETLIGLTIVAVGTSLPELATSVIAALRKQSEVALGNILGSNIYNILGIGGVTGLLAPTIIPPELVRFDLIVMLVATLALLFFARSGMRIGRTEGAVLLGSYVLYIIASWPTTML
ncbi:MAG: calcium/sodium antiporter [Hyphomicrobiaceae bacterium]